jgi:hypothetical protein
LHRYFLKTSRKMIVACSATVMFISILVLPVWGAGSANAAGKCEAFFEKIRTNEINLNAMVANAFDVDEPVELEFYMQSRTPTDVNTQNNSVKVSGDLEIGIDLGHGIRGDLDCWYPLSSSSVKLSAFDLRPLNFVSFAEKPEWLHIQGDDWAVFHISFRGDTTQKFDLRSFPFDKQNVDVNFEFYTEEKGFNLAGIEVDLHEDYGSFVAEWSPERSSLRSRFNEAGTYPVIETSWKIERQSTFYVLKFLVPALLIYLISCLAYALSHSDRAIRMSSVILFSTFSLFLASSSAVAKVGYLTLFDLVLVVQMILVLTQLFLVFAWAEEIKIGRIEFQSPRFRRAVSGLFIVGYLVFYWLAYESYVNGLELF